MVVDALGRKIVALGAAALRPLLQRVWASDDDETQVLRKASLVATAAGVLLATPAVVGIPAATGEEGNGFLFVGVALTAGVSVYSLAHLLIVKHASEGFCTAVMAVYMLSIACLDLHSAMSLQGSRAVALVVVALDVAIVARLQAANYVFLAAVLWITCMDVELWIRFGLLDLPMGPAADRRAAACDCARPPCASPPSAFLNSYLTALFVYGMDFGLTRHFADSVVSERDKMKAAVATTQAIAECFARFDLERASVILRSSDLPGELDRALSVILRNLGSYRPYIPSALFELDAGRDVPGADGAAVAIVFTDVRQSTKLWEYSGPAMEAALLRHNDAVRDAIATFGGYEVKTIGDAFMVALPSAAQAVAFGLAVQAELAGMVWPEALSRGDDGDGDGFDVFMVRIGVHYGETTVKEDPATGRSDYFGGTVNMAARVEALGAPGAVTVTAEVLDACRAEAATTALADAQEVQFAGLREARGFAEKVQLTALLPPGAARYEGLVRAHCAAQEGRRDRRMTSLGGFERQHSFGSESYTSFGSGGHVRERIVHSGGGTICVVRLRHTKHLPQLGACLGSSDGRIATVFGEFAVLSWGAQRPVRWHARKAAAFLQQLAAVEVGDGLGLDGSPPPFSAGAASGPVVSLHTAASTAQRFVTVGGPCVDVAVALCSGAAALGAAALAAALEGDLLDAEVEVPLRQVDVWEVGEARVQVQVYDLCFACTGAAAAAYCSAYLAGDADELRRCADEDPVLTEAGRMAARGEHLQHASLGTSRAVSAALTPVMSAAGRPLAMEAAAMD
eukprot:TRINITY_DN9097_c1_g2_i1.p1 TRINITY_DN9097_c1_g2~~TRINITY_DN9097_c1_g2_i1.p1  ORF type:complete len:796 (+),score=243.34 TRINITY_DN9097_c1_g2_i1:69-2456(+)